MLNQVGVISGNDITPEAALAKLSYVLSKDDWDLSTKRMVSTYYYVIHFKLFNLYVCQTNHSCCVKILFLLLPAFINLREFSLPPPNHYSACLDPVLCPSNSVHQRLPNFFLRHPSISYTGLPFSYRFPAIQYHLGIYLINLVHLFNFFLPPFFFSPHHLR